MVISTMVFRESNQGFSPKEKKLPETILGLNPNLVNVVNDGLNRTIGSFYQENEQYFNSEDSSDPKERGRVIKYLRNLDILGEAISDENESENYKEEDSFVLRESRLDDSGTYFFRFAPKSKIDYSRLTKQGSFGVDLTRGPVEVCQMAISPFCEYHGHNPDPSLLISQTGYKIDYSLRVCSLQSGQIKYSNRLAGVGIKIYDKINTAEAYLLRDLGNTDFVSPKSFPLTISIKDFQPTINFFKSLGLADPLEQFK